MSNISCVKATAAFLADGWLAVVSPPNGRETASLTLATQLQEALGAAPCVSLRVTCVKMAPEERAIQKTSHLFHNALGNTSAFWSSAQATYESVQP